LVLSMSCLSSTRSVSDCLTRLVYLGFLGVLWFGRGNLSRFLRGMGW
jgi:hypothetical protein